MWAAGFRVLGDAKGSAYLSFSHKFSTNGFAGLVQRRMSRNRGVVPKSRTEMVQAAGVTRVL